MVYFGATARARVVVYDVAAGIVRLFEDPSRAFWSSIAKQENEGRSLHNVAADPRSARVYATARLELSAAIPSIVFQADGEWRVACRSITEVTNHCVCAHNRRATNDRRAGELERRRVPRFGPRCGFSWSLAAVALLCGKRPELYDNVSLVVMRVP